MYSPKTQWVLSQVLNDEDAWKSIGNLCLYEWNDNLVDVAIAFPFSAANLSGTRSLRMTHKLGTVYSLASLASQVELVVNKTR